MRRLGSLLLFLSLFSMMGVADELTFHMQVQFAVNSSVVDAKYDDQLKWMARFMERYPNCSVVVHGHSDSSGNKKKNLALSWERAGAVRKFILEKYGVAAERIAAEGHGDSVPGIADNTPAGRAANRRVTMAVAKDKPGAFKGLKKDIVLYDTPAVVFEEVPSKIADVEKPASAPVREVANFTPTSTSKFEVSRARERCPLLSKTCINQFEFGLFAAHHSARTSQFISGSVVSLSLDWTPQWYRWDRLAISSRIGELLLHDQDGGSFIALETGLLFGYDVAERWTILAGPLFGYWTQSEVKGFSPGISLGAQWFVGLDAAFPKVGVEYVYWYQNVASVHLFRFNLGVAL